MIPGPAADDGVAADPRKGVEVSFRLDRASQHEEAAALIDELAAKHPHHQMVLYTAGRIHFCAGTRAARAQRGEEMERHLLSARRYFAEAKRVCPNCIDTSLALAETLYESSKHDEADEELRRGIGIEFPVDPAESNIVYSVGSRYKTKDQRVKFVRESAFRFSPVFDESRVISKPSFSDFTFKMDEEYERRAHDILHSYGIALNRPKPSNGLKDHKSVDNQQTMNFKSLCSDVTLKMDEEHKRSEVHVEDEDSDAMVNGKPSEEPIEMNGYGRTSDQPAEEMPIICRYKKNVEVLNNRNAHEDLFSLNIIMQSLWNLRCFCKEILRRPPACFHLLHDCPCIAGKLYEILFALEKTEHFRMPTLLTDLKTTLCEIIHDKEMYYEMQAGRIIFSRVQVGRNFASEIIAMIIEGLHKSETYLHFRSYGTVENVVIHPTSCTDFICRAHDLFGITIKQLMSCNCGERFSEEYTSIFHALDASSLYTTKINSIAQLPVLMDQQLNREIKCNKCTRIIKHVDYFLSRGAHFFTIVLKNWKISDISKDTMYETFFIIASPFDITLLYRGVILPAEGVQSSTKYNLVVAICHVEERYVCFVRDQEKWCIYDIDGVQVFDSWEELLKSYREISIRPEVLFFEVIK